ncbi:hypothetical protein A2716_00065 [candidate division WWE3 bacterium RIFCSPHIGHO2_01_FULL_40_23]|nr:MAG: hypothetical protein A2716_00065 [candidate division WWE3 bacterium RIFCSPHIGHO2_01_FULL_40_23]
MAQTFGIPSEGGPEFQEKEIETLSRMVEDATLLEALEKEPEQIAGKIKWAITNFKREGTSRAEILGHIEAQLIGVVGERLSEALPLELCRVVYGEQPGEGIKISKTSSLSTSSPEAASKAFILSQAHTKFLQENKPLLYKLIDMDEIEDRVSSLSGTQKELRRKVLVDEAIRALGRDLELGFAPSPSERFSQKGPPQFAGIYNQATVIPDSILTMGDSVEGICEVKTWPPYMVRSFVNELRQARSAGTAVTVPRKALNKNASYYGEVNKHFSDTKLGIDIEREILFIDLVRALKENSEPFEKKAFVVLRFPSDAPSDSLNSLGEYLKELGYQNTTIQTLPFSYNRIKELALDTLRKLMPEIEAKKLKFNFSDEETSIIKDMLQIK